MTLAPVNRAPGVRGIVYTLHPGDVICGERGDRLETLLGSCVAIALTDRRRSIGAMCHIVHCRPAMRVVDNPCAFADVAIEAIYGLLRLRNLTPPRCQAYVYGGGNMFPHMARVSNIGADNAHWALQRLAEDGVEVLYHDLGGSTYRRISWTIGNDAPHVTAVQV